jgi:DNA-binding Lrp family transcriptional regulator
MIVFHQKEGESLKEILKILEEDDKTPPEKIATMLGVSVEKVKSEIDKLEKMNAIIKYKAVVDWEKIGEEVLYAFIEVRVIPERDTGFDGIARRIYKFPEVHSLYLMSGAYDFCVVVKGRSMKDIANFVAEKLAPLKGVQGTATHFVLKKYKVDGVLIEEKEADKRLAISP